ncbi:MAG TPA: hypothetical protein VMB47_16135 [Candidatus Aquilonibacter sp.]|nr:hypothetical protein [Candidatus Aquilonibacter sp.]
MPLPNCPVCHHKTVYAGNTPYCPNCGWNHDAAISAMKMSINAIPIGIFMFGVMAAFMFWGMKFNRAPQLMLFVLFPLVIIPFNYLFYKRKIAKLKAMQFPGSSQPPPSNFPSTWNAATSASSTPAFAPSAKDEALLRTPAPRQIRVSKGGRLTMWVAAFGLAAFVVPFAVNLYRQWTLYHSFASVRGLGWGITLECVVAFAGYGIWRGQVRECDLLEHGEAVMGHVTRQWTDTKNNSSIAYEFTDFLGSLHKGSVLDRSNQLFAGMPLVVFYDRDNPKRQIAYCSTLHEVILPATASSNSEELIAKR